MLFPSLLTYLFDRASPEASHHKRNQCSISKTCRVGVLLLTRVLVQSLYGKLTDEERVSYGDHESPEKGTNINMDERF